MDSVSKECFQNTSVDFQKKVEKNKTFITRNFEISVK